MIRCECFERINNLHSILKPKVQYHYPSPPVRNYIVRYTCSLPWKPLSDSAFFPIIAANLKVSCKLMNFTTREFRSKNSQALIFFLEDHKVVIALHFSTQFFLV
jgi:hypothetical protein